MKNQIVEHEEKSYIVEEVKDDKLKCKEFVFDTLTEKFVKLDSKTVEDGFKVIPLEIVKIKHRKEVKPKKKPKEK